MVKAAKLFPCLQGPFANHIIVMRAIQHAIAGRNGVGGAAGGDALSAKPWHELSIVEHPNKKGPARIIFSKKNIEQLKCIFERLTRTCQNKVLGPRCDSTIRSLMRFFPPFSLQSDNRPRTNTSLSKLPGLFWTCSFCYTFYC